MGDWAESEGAPGPLGVTYVPGSAAYNFALYSRHGEGVTLQLYSRGDLRTPLREIPLDPLRNKTGRVWHCRLSEEELEAASSYAFRVRGPFEPSRGHWFDEQKVLLDPYARQLAFPPGFEPLAASRPGSSAGAVPLAELPRPRPAFDWGASERPRHDSDLVIYEMHVGGFTRHPSSGVAPPRRGTFAGVIDKIPYLLDLGVTAVELMPVQQFDVGFDGNYWGYMTLAFFALHAGYGQSESAAERIDEFKAMVKALHEAGIEVILDVVYNHTAELGAGGPYYGFRGIDNSTYYLLTADMAQYRNDAGTGNVLRTGHPAVRRLVLDSLRYWVTEMRVDGFRFDLASILSRSEDGVLLSEDAQILSEIGSDPTLCEVRLIAEPWDVAAYQLGRSFPARSWQQWNGQYRDTVRSFVKSDPGQVAALMTRLYGSDDLFPDALAESYRAYQSVNFVTAHDGFCLYDLVSYDEKRNLANGYGNADGSDDNRSWNCGFEGDPAPPAVMELRARQIKNFCALLFLSNGTPMMLAGDEFMNTQQGNNNPYNQDNETSWLNWALQEQNASMFRFWKKMIAFRKAHPTLQRSRYQRADVRWYGVRGAPDLSFSSRTIARFLSGASESDRDLYLMVNAYWEPLTFEIGEPPSAGAWRRVIDTSLQSPEDFAEEGQGPVIASEYRLGPRSLVLLQGGP